MLILVECAYELLLLGVPTMSWILTGDPCLPLQKYPPVFLDQTNPLIRKLCLVSLLTKIEQVNQAEVYGLTLTNYTFLKSL